MATTNDLKNGLVLNLDGQLWSVTAFQHVKPGKGGAFVRTTLKNVLTGKVVDKTFNAGTKVDTATVDRRDMTFLYRDGADFVFMDGDTYDQIPIPARRSATAADYLLENQKAMVALHEGVPLYIELPTSVELVISHTDPGLQGDRSTGGTKPATLETGAEIQVPLFLTTGEKVKVDTRDGRYLGRVSRLMRCRRAPRPASGRSTSSSSPRRAATTRWRCSPQRRETDDARRCRTTRRCSSRAWSRTGSASTSCSPSTPRAGRWTGCPPSTAPAAHRRVRAAVGRRDRRPGGDHRGRRAGPHAVDRRRAAVPQRRARPDRRHRRALRATAAR